MASTILDVAIGISFVFMLLSVIASAVTEAISAVFSLRAVTLRQGIERLLNDRTLTNKLYAHPLIDGLTKDDDADPSYIGSELFARALVDVVGGWDDEKDVAKMPRRMGLLVALVMLPARAVRGFLRRLWPSTNKADRGPHVIVMDLAAFKARLGTAKGLEEHTRAVLVSLVSKEGVATLDDATHEIAAWFDRAMESVSGWYKRSVTLLISTVAFVMAVSLNVDTFLVVDSLGRDAVLRASVAAAVTEGVKSDKPEVRAASAMKDEQKAAVNATPEQVFGAEKKDVELLVRARVVAIKKGLDELTLPVGWPEDKPLFCRPAGDEVCDRRSLVPSLAGFFRRLGGWLFTAVAISLGAPFWFDLLNKLINLRAAAAPPAKTQPKPRSGPLSSSGDDPSAAAESPFGGPAARPSASPSDASSPLS